jgi:hypothetical protein
MFRIRLLPVVLFSLLCSAPLGAQEQPDFEKWFEDVTLRVDYHHWGNSTSEDIALSTISEEGHWAGSRTHLTDLPDYGKYRFRILDLATGTVLYEDGYSTLFGEWQTTAEAKKIQQVFHETVRFPRPRSPFQLEILSRNKKGLLVTVFSEEISPDSYRIRSFSARPDVEIMLLHNGGEPERSLDVVIIADGYADRQLDKARADLKRYAEVLLATPPFDSHRDRISVRGVITPCGQPGPDEPRKGVYGHTAAGSTFDTFGSARYLTTIDNLSLRDLAGQVPYDTIYLMVNSSRYGGAGIYNFFSIFVSDNEYDEYVFIHEFGHGFGGLGDEYYTSSVAYSDFYPRGVEPWEPNVTAMLKGRKSVKWESSLSKDIPVPTPETPQFAESIGVFEGAGYSAKGLFRPAIDCKMFSKKEIDFCPVCMKAVEERILLYTE